MRLNKIISRTAKPGRIREAACGCTARRPFFAMADIEENARRKAAERRRSRSRRSLSRWCAHRDRAVAHRATINGKEPRRASRGFDAPVSRLWYALMTYNARGGRPTKLSRRANLAKAIQ